MNARLIRGIKRRKLRERVAERRFLIRWQLRLAYIENADNLVKLKKETVLKTENGKPVIYDKDKKEILLDPQNRCDSDGTDLGLGGPKVIR